MRSGSMPSSTAAVSAIALNVDPACRAPWVARLNFCTAKLVLDCIATIAPVRGWIDTITAAGSPGVFRTPAIARRAANWRRRLIVVSIERPPFSSCSAPPGSFWIRTCLA